MENDLAKILGESLLNCRALEHTNIIPKVIFLRGPQNEYFQH